MSDPCAVLDEIRDRVDRMVTPDGVHSPPDRYLTDAERLAGNWDCIANIAGDLTRLVAAVRVVLSNHWCIEDGEECGYDGRPWPCPDYRAITDALGVAS